MTTASPLQTDSALTPHIRKIAAFTDFSAAATRALEYAAALARIYKSRMVLAHAYLQPSSAFAAPESSLVLELLDQIHHALEERLTKETKTPPLQGLPCETLLVVGGVSDLLREANDADLIVIGTSGEGGLGKMTFGSSAEEVFRSATVPVLTVGPCCGKPSGKPDAIRTILYATDFSVAAERAWPYAMSMAKEQEAELILLHVEDDRDAPFSFDQAIASVEPRERMLRLIPDGIRLRVRPQVAFGKPDKVILAQALSHHASMIIMGARGADLLPGLTSHFGGRTAYQVAANARCPVLTISR